MKNNIELRYDVSDKYLKYFKKQLTRREVNFETNGTNITFKISSLQAVGEALEDAIEDYFYYHRR